MFLLYLAAELGFQMWGWAHCFVCIASQFLVLPKKHLCSANAEDQDQLRAGS